MTTILKRTAWVALMAALPLVAHATTAPTFDFYYNGGPLIDQTSVTPQYNAGSLGVSFSGYVNNVQSYVTDRVDGLGVTNDSISNGGDITKGESLVLTFNKAVTLSSLEFSWWSNGLPGLGDTATLSWGNNSITLGNNNDGGAVLKTFSLANVVGTTFTITATGSFSGFRLAGITATAAAVPEASTFALMGLGLAGLGWVRRRQTAEA